MFCLPPNFCCTVVLLCLTMSLCYFVLVQKQSKISHTGISSLLHLSLQWMREAWTYITSFSYTTRRLFSWRFTGNITYSLPMLYLQGVSHLPVILNVYINDWLDNHFTQNPCIILRKHHFMNERAIGFPQTLMSNFFSEWLENKM